MKPQSPPPRITTEEDKKRQQLNAAASRGVIVGLKQCLAGNPHRTIRALDEHDILVIATECIGEWSTEYVKIRQSEDREWFHGLVDDWFV